MKLSLSKGPNWRILVGAFLAVTAIAFLLAELVTAAYFLFFAKMYYRPSWADGRNTSAHWYTEYHAWGAWHRAESEARQTTSCFSVAYRSNSAGARDRERTTQSTSTRFLVLGDSFTEGYGVPETVRLTNLLEEALGVEFLNFASAGDFGPLQYYLVYRDLAMRYSHDAVLIGFLPENDFFDNFAPFWQKHRQEDFSSRYRPYARATANGYEIFYSRPRPSPETDFSNNKPLSEVSRVARHFWLGGLLAMAKRTQITRLPATGYLETDSERIALAEHYLRRIKDLAGKPVIVYFIPGNAEVKHAKRNGTNDFDTFYRFIARLRNAGIQVVDLLPEFVKLSEAQLSATVLGCDDHWSERGNRYAAEILTRHLKGFLTAPKL